MPTPEELQALGLNIQPYERMPPLDPNDNGLNGLPYSPWPGNLDAMSDDELANLARSLGINFGGGQNPDIFSIDPRVESTVGRIFDAKRSLGQEELRRKAVEATGARGLNMTDTPIFDPYMRGLGLFESQLRGDEAQSLLGIGQDYSRQRDSFLQNLYNVQAQIAQNAENNRVNLFSNMANIGLGLNSNRMGRPTGTTQTTTGINPGNLGAGLGLIGSGLGALGNINYSGIGDWLSGVFGGGGGGDSGTTFQDWFTDSDGFLF